jgi:hypothetical protein
MLDYMNTTLAIFAMVAMLGLTAAALVAIPYVPQASAVGKPTTLPNQNAINGCGRTTHGGPPGCPPT